MDEYGADLESDLLRFWGIDLVAELGTPRLTWRRLGVLIDRLPPESAVYRTVAGDEASMWTPDRHLLAGVIDRLGVVSYLLGGTLVSMGAVKENPIPAPEPLERPGVEKAAPKKPEDTGLRALAKKMGQRVKLS